MLNVWLDPPLPVFVPHCHPSAHNSSGGITQSPCFVSESLNTSPSVPKTVWPGQSTDTEGDFLEIFHWSKHLKQWNGNNDLNTQRNPCRRILPRLFEAKSNLLTNSSRVSCTRFYLATISQIPDAGISLWGDNLCNIGTETWHQRQPLPLYPRDKMLCNFLDLQEMSEKENEQSRVC